MADEWYFRTIGQEFGPLTFEELAHRAQQGEVGPDDDVRQGPRGNWFAASEVVGLFGSTDDDFVVSTATSERREVSGHSGQNGSDDDPRAWYFSSLGTEFGPLTFSELYSMAQEEDLSPDDEIRFGEDGHWIPAGSLEGLFANQTESQPAETAPPPPVAAAPAQPAAAAAAPPSPPPVPSPAAPVAPPAAASAAPAPTGDEARLLEQLLQLLKQDLAREGGNLGFVAPSASAIPENQQWYCRIGEQEMGPLTIDTLVQMVLQGRVFPDDMLRLGTTGDWFPAGAVEELFPAGRTNVANPHATKKPQLPEAEGILERLDRMYAEQAAMEAEQAKSAPAGPAAQAAATSASVAPPKSAANDIIRNMNANILRAGSVKKQQEKENRESLIEQLKNNPQGTAVAGVLIVGVLLYWIIPSFLLGMRAKAAYRELSAIHQELDAARAANSNPTALASAGQKLKERALAVRKSLAGSPRGTPARDLERTAGYLMEMTDAAPLADKEETYGQLEASFTQAMAKIKRDLRL